MERNYDLNLYIKKRQYTGWSWRRKKRLFELPEDTPLVDRPEYAAPRAVAEDKIALKLWNQILCFFGSNENRMPVRSLVLLEMYVLSYSEIRQIRAEIKKGPKVLRHAINGKTYFNPLYRIHEKQVGMFMQLGTKLRLFVDIGKVDIPPLRLD